MPDQFRQLDPARLLSTAENIANETEKTFPASGLSNVAKEVVSTTRTTFDNAADIARPRYGIRAIIGKLAAFYIQHLRDRTVLDAVNEIETLTNGFSQKLWQKVMIINHMAESRREKTRDEPKIIPG